MFANVFKLLLWLKEWAGQNIPKTLQNGTSVRSSISDLYHIQEIQVCLLLLLGSFAPPRHLGSTSPCFASRRVHPGDPAAEPLRGESGEGVRPEETDLTDGRISSGRRSDLTVFISPSFILLVFFFSK